MVVVFVRFNGPFWSIVMFKSFVAALSLTALAVSIGISIAEATQKPDWPNGCLTSDGLDGFSAQYIDPNTMVRMEKVRIPAVGEPIVERATNGRGSVRAKCSAMVLERFGAARAKQLLRLSD